MKKKFKCKKKDLGFSKKYGNKESLTEFSVCGISITFYSV